MVYAWYIRPIRFENSIRNRIGLPIRFEIRFERKKTICRSLMLCAFDSSKHEQLMQSHLRRSYGEFVIMSASSSLGLRAERPFLDPPICCPLPADFAELNTYTHTTAHPIFLDKTDDLSFIALCKVMVTFLAVAYSPLASSCIVYPVFFLNSATKFFF